MIKAHTFVGKYLFNFAVKKIFVKININGETKDYFFN